MSKLRTVRNGAFLLMALVFLAARAGRVGGEDLGCQFSGYRGPNTLCMTEPADVETHLSSCEIGNEWTCDANLADTCNAFCGMGNVVDGGCHYSRCDDGGGGEVEPFKIMVDWYIDCECSDVIDPES